MSAEFLFSDSLKTTVAEKAFPSSTSDFGPRTSDLDFTPIDDANSNRDLHHILQDYFYQEYGNFVIMAFLVVVHNIPDARRPYFAVAIETFCCIT